jgi:hypothetical protein
MFLADSLSLSQKRLQNESLKRWLDEGIPACCQLPARNLWLVPFESPFLRAQRTA